MEAPELPVVLPPLFCEPEPDEPELVPLLEIDVISPSGMKMVSPTASLASLGRLLYDKISERLPLNFLEIASNVSPDLTLYLTPETGKMTNCWPTAILLFFKSLAHATVFTVTPNILAMAGNVSPVRTT